MNNMTTVAEEYFYKEEYLGLGLESFLIALKDKIAEEKDLIYNTKSPNKLLAVISVGHSRKFIGGEAWIYEVNVFSDDPEAYFDKNLLKKREQFKRLEYE